MAKKKAWMGARMHMPDIITPKGLEVVRRDGEGAHIRGNRQGSTTAVAEGGGKNGRPQLRM